MKMFRLKLYNVVDISTALIISRYDVIVIDKTSTETEVNMRKGNKITDRYLNR